MFGANAKQNLREFGRPKPWIDWEEGPVRGAIVSEEVCGKVRFIPGQGHQAATDDAPDAKGKKPSFRFAALFWDQEENFIKKLEGPESLYEAIMALGKRINLSKAVIEIERTGSGSGTKYEVIGVGTLTDDDITKIDACERPDLHLLCKWLPGQPVGAEGYPGDSGEVPF